MLLGILLLILTVAGPVSRILTGVGDQVPVVDLSVLTSLLVGRRRDRLPRRRLLRDRGDLRPGPAPGGHPGRRPWARVRRPEHAHLGGEHPADHRRRPDRRPRRHDGGHPDDRLGRARVGRVLDDPARPDSRGRAARRDRRSSSRAHSSTQPAPTCRESGGSRMGTAIARRTCTARRTGGEATRGPTPEAPRTREPGRGDLHRRDDQHDGRPLGGREGPDPRRRGDPRSRAGHREDRRPGPDRSGPNAREPLHVPEAVRDRERDSPLPGRSDDRRRRGRPGHRRDRGDGVPVGPRPRWRCAGDRDRRDARRVRPERRWPFEPAQRGPLRHRARAARRRRAGGPRRHDQPGGRGHEDARRARSIRSSAWIPGRSAALWASRSSSIAGAGHGATWPRIAPPRACCC